MVYKILPFGGIWDGGMFSVPSLVAKNYIKLASEYQLKALLIILSNGGNADSRLVAKILGCTESDADDFLEFWIDEGVLQSDLKEAAPKAVKTEEKAPEKEEKKPKKKELEILPAPTLTPPEIVAALRDIPELRDMLQTAQEVKGKTLSTSEESVLINAHQYYGLPCEVTLTILQYYVGEKSKGKAIGTAYLGAMAKNWSEEGITTLDAAEEKLKELENSNRLWKEILAACSITYRNPTRKQREMIKNWADNFSSDLIFYACELMCENAEKPTVKYVDSIIKNWKKAGIKSVEQAKEENKKHKESKEKPNNSKLKSKPSFDISEIEKKAMFDDNYDI